MNENEQLMPESLEMIVGFARLNRHSRIMWFYEKVSTDDKKLLAKDSKSWHTRVMKAYLVVSAVSAWMNNTMLVDDLDDDDQAKLLPEPR